MNQSAFGYEQEDGRIHYALTKTYTFDELLDYMNSRKVPQPTNITYIAPSIEDYFCKTLVDKDNSNWRIVFLLDGTTLCRHSSKQGEIVYKP